jgi:hypothetical protein
MVMRTALCGAAQWRYRVARHGGRDDVAAAAWRRAAFEHLLQQLLLGCDGVAGESRKDGQKEVSGHRRSS